MATIAFLDIEASGLGPGSYPIEVAIACIDDETLELGVCETWLICPTDEWDEYAWDPAAEEVHGLSRDLLEREGCSAWFVADALNKALSDAVAIYSDAPLSDSNWLSVLYEEFPGSCGFGLRDFNGLLNQAFSGVGREHALAALKAARDAADQANPEVHRALPDALRLRDTWRHVVTLRPGAAPTASTTPRP